MSSCRAPDVIYSIIKSSAVNHRPGTFPQSFMLLFIKFFSEFLLWNHYLCSVSSVNWDTFLPDDNGSVTCSNSVWTPRSFISYITNITYHPLSTVYIVTNCKRLLTQVIMLHSLQMPNNLMWYIIYEIACKTLCLIDVSVHQILLR